MAVAGITAVSNAATAQARLDKLRADQLAADDAKAKQLEQDQQDERDRVEKADAEKQLQRTEAQKGSEKERVEKQDAARAAAQVEARRQAQLERNERLEANREVERVLQDRSERSRIEGLNAYRAQNDRVQTVSATTNRLSVDQLRAEPASTVRAQLTAVEATRIDKIDLSEIARARLEGAVGLRIIQPTAASGV